VTANTIKSYASCWGRPSNLILFQFPHFPYDNYKYEHGYDTEVTERKHKENSDRSIPSLLIMLRKLCSLCDAEERENL
jgi:hypothetical protein